MMMENSFPAAGTYRKGYPMNKDKKEKNRKLTPAEERRLRNFRNLSEEMEQNGYQIHERTISLVRANILILIAVIPLTAAVMILFYNLHPKTNSFEITGIGIPIAIALVVLLPVVHELIHGFVWGLFSKHHFHDIEFGVIWKYGAAYCTCRQPLERSQYLLGGVMPLIVLGLLPLLFGLYAGSMILTLVGLYMTIAAGGDVMILIQLLTFHTDAQDVVIYDHPTQGGCVVFTK
jgi:hypothetical protein